MIRKIKSWKYREIVEKNEKVRAKKFMDFTKKYIKETNFTIDENTNDFSFDSNIDCYVIGSDQVWNYNFPRFSKLDFVEYSQKTKISYAASFGVNKIPDEFIPIYEKGLKGIDYISVRENAGKEIVSDLCRKNADVVLDPTLLISKDEWKSVSEDAMKIQKKYVLTYFLDDVNKLDKEYIDNFAEKKQCDVRKLLSVDDPMLMTADPLDFVSLIYNAEAIFTDSFHASVFSIIFQKYFEVFDRNNSGGSMSSRLETLLLSLNLEERWHSKYSHFEKIDYKKAYEILNNRRNSSYVFIKEALDKV